MIEKSQQLADNISKLLSPKKLTNQRRYEFLHLKQDSNAFPITIDSYFSCGNVSDAEMIFQQQSTVLNIKGNPDVVNESSAKYWLYFRMSGLREDTVLLVKLRNAKVYRKFVKEKKFRPHIVYRRDDTDWQSVLLNLDQQEDEIIASFTLILKQIDIKHKSLHFALNYPYGMEQLQSYISNFQHKSTKKTYINCQTLCYSKQLRKVNLITITAKENIKKPHETNEMFSKQLFPEVQKRSLKMVDSKPCLFFSARVHPSEIASSYFIQGLIDFLTNQQDPRSQIIRDMFVIYIVPILNPDGVQSGNYRLDNNSSNLNRFYGHSSFQDTYLTQNYRPSIKAVQILLQKLSKSEKKGVNKLLMYFDVHGHNSPKPSFLYGNFTQNISHAVQNRFFCKILERNFANFCYLDSQFSQKNMTTKEKYDKYSKLSSGRVFAGQNLANISQQSQRQIYHAYTVEINPYRALKQKGSDRQKSSRTNTIQESNNKYPCQYDMRSSYKQFGTSFAISILDLFQMNPNSKLQPSIGFVLRKLLYRELNRSITDNHRIAPKQVYEQNMNEYFRRWFSKSCFFVKCTPLQRQSIEKGQIKQLNFIKNGRKYYQASALQEEKRQNLRMKTINPQNHIPNDQQSQKYTNCSISTKYLPNYSPICMSKNLLRKCQQTKREKQLDSQACHPELESSDNEDQDTAEQQKIDKQLRNIRNMCRRSLKKTDGKQLNQSAQSILELPPNLHLSEEPRKVTFSSVNCNKMPLQGDKNDFIQLESKCPAKFNYYNYHFYLYPESKIDSKNGLSLRIQEKKFQSLEKKNSSNNFIIDPIFKDDNLVKSNNGAYEIYHKEAELSTQLEKMIKNTTKEAIVKSKTNDDKTYGTISYSNHKKSPYKNRKQDLISSLSSSNRYTGSLQRSIAQIFVSNDGKSNLSAVIHANSGQNNRKKTIQRMLKFQRKANQELINREKISEPDILIEQNKIESDQIQMDTKKIRKPQPKRVQCFKKDKKSNKETIDRSTPCIHTSIEHKSSNIIIKQQKRVSQKQQRLRKERKVYEQICRMVSNDKLLNRQVPKRHYRNRSCLPIIDEYKNFQQ